MSGLERKISNGWRVLVSLCKTSLTFRCQYCAPTHWIVSLDESSAEPNSWDLGANACAGTDFEPVQEIYSGAWPRIARAINWAAKYRLGVLVDLHGKSNHDQ